MGGWVGIGVGVFSSTGVDMEAGVEDGVDVALGAEVGVDATNGVEVEAGKTVAIAAGAVEESVPVHPNNGIKSTMLNTHNEILTSNRIFDLPSFSNLVILALYHPMCLLFIAD